MNVEQVNLFDVDRKKYKIQKPIRLIELFAGIGSQAKALKNLGANFEHYRVVEWDKHAMKSYNAIHGTNFETSDITKIHASDLEIVDTDKYEYIMTYSFPCQDLSLAGLGKGMEKGSGTRSGLLWEVERILKECNELPQVLLMENVPQVHNKNNIEDFNKWINFLESIGYVCFWKDLNGKDYGIPQNRNRTFMVSIKGYYNYEFPTPIPLELKLKDFLEDNVDEKYYLSDEKIHSISHWKAQQKPFEKVNGKESIVPTLTARGAGEEHSGMVTYCDELENTTNLQEQCLHIKCATKKGYLEAEHGDGVDISSRIDGHRGTVQKEKSLTIKAGIDCGVVVKNDNLESKVGQSGLVQPLDRKYKEHNQERKEHIEFKEDNCSHALRTSVIPVTVVKNDNRD